ncbi:O-methylsterigmatocystin oxidoreductase [Grifola frondosa]|uniref:O-methylsterigmatocystin oxidoreductase n=1 Tax=Grifola frondosa TaxID=5627 RepID=A0A1C7LTH4_GRIFR|nr:O-methylsterigmatocystin oxidoreductase [Grifola frondosa]
MQTFDLFVALLSLAVLGIATLWMLHRPVSTSPLPPGPKPLPIVGNMFDVPTIYPWLMYRDLSKKYGDVLHLRVLGQSIIVIGSSQVAYDLLEKRSSNYSDRGYSTMVSLTGWEWNLGFIRYGQWWRRIRRTFHQHFNHSTIPKYREVQLHESRRLLRNLIVNPAQFVEHIRFAFAATVLKIAYGINIPDNDVVYTTMAEEGLKGIVEGLVPGTFWVEYFPFLRYIPSWFPGAGFQRKLETWRADAYALRDVPFASVKDAFNDGNAPPCISTELLVKLSQHDGDVPDDEEEVVKNAVGIAYAAGADTTFSAMQWFFFAMLSNPEVQHKVQAELDAVVGSNRLPEFSDRDSLPYTNAVVLECFRWQGILPLGVAHRSIADDEYNGYHIPGGSILLPNIWAFTHDPEMYPEPEKFHPERFIKNGQLDPDVKDPKMLIFGFGRRICPGRHLADATFFINVASVLHVYNISPPPMQTISQSRLSQ